MSYNLELSFDVMKQNHVTSFQNHIKSIAEEFNCTCVYNDYEIHSKDHRNHCIITIEFEHQEIHSLILFVRNIKKIEGLYIESIYNESSHSLVYASTYYQTKKMSKGCAKEYKEEKRTRSYSEEDVMILDTMKQ
jgi:hypothetical protein